MCQDICDRRCYMLLSNSPMDFSEAEMLQAVVDPAECIWLGSLVLGSSDHSPRIHVKGIHRLILWI